LGAVFPGQPIHFVGKCRAKRLERSRQQQVADVLDGLSKLTKTLF
jgi:hypothetical protein